ncbi:MAG: DUF2478 domain-containing protein [Rubrivivax sp.]|nr:DUF2478 domain-containing protein [Rubrivivax sp.]
MTPDPAAAVPPDDSLRAAAIVDDGSHGVDALLAALVARLRAGGVRVRGLLMTRPAAERGCAATMVLVDIDTQEDYLVSQPLGRNSTSCRADPQGFARASGVLRRAADEAPDLVVVNRFGGLEVEGKGFRAELLELMTRDVPLLTTVGARHVPDWQQFSGGATLLPADGAAVDAWLRTVLPQRFAAPGAEAARPAAWKG